MDEWKVAFAPDDFMDAPQVAGWEFLKPHYTPKKISESEQPDAAGLLHTTIVGMPAVDEAGNPLRLDEERAPIAADDTETPPVYTPFMLWQDTLVNGKTWESGLNLLVPDARVVSRYPQVGGYLARTAYPAVVAAERAVNPNAKPEEAWGWLPPPLVGEGHKVQSEWLYQFLLDPHPIRPAVVLRMPKFNMSPDDSRKLVNYFAAVDGADYPYDFDPRTRESHLAAAQAKYPERMDDALKIVISNSYCVQCHLLGNFSPMGGDRAKAPQLDRVHERLRPQWVLDWTANPKRLLPYTGMPVNIPHDKGVSQELYKGTPREQLNAVVDLLMNYDRYTEGKTTITPIKSATPEAAADTAPPAAQAGGPAQ
jgi:hypothetical protein